MLFSITCLPAIGWSDRVGHLRDRPKQRNNACREISILRSFPPPDEMSDTDLGRKKKGVDGKTHCDSMNDVRVVEFPGELLSSQ
jgi:hypothetical protein